MKAAHEGEGVEGLQKGFFLLCFQWHDVLVERARNGFLPL